MLPFSLDLITISKFSTVLPDTSRPPNMCYCGKSFDNNLEVVAHNSESHKDGYTCGYEGGTGPTCNKSSGDKGKMWIHVRTVHLKLFNKKCKCADCLWPGCDEEAERLQHYVKKHGEEHPEITCQSYSIRQLLSITRSRPYLHVFISHVYYMYMTMYECTPFLSSRNPDLDCVSRQNFNIRN